MVKEQVKIESYNRRVAERAQEAMLDKLEHAMKDSLAAQLEQLRAQIAANDRLFYEEFPAATEERLARIAAVSR